MKLLTFVIGWFGWLVFWFNDLSLLLHGAQKGSKKFVKGRR